MTTLPETRMTDENECGSNGESFYRIAECTGEGILVIQDGRIRYTNPAMQTLLGVPVVGREEGDFRDSPGHAPGTNPLSLTSPAEKSPAIQARHAAGTWCGRPAAIWFFPARLAGDRMNRTEKAILLGRIMRHGIANQLTILRRALRTTEIVAGDPAVPHLRKMERAAREIHHQLETAHAYQELGSGSPDWFSLTGLLRPVTAFAESEGIQCRITTGSCRIFADPLVTHVFGNLLDNTLRHGARVTCISVSSHCSDRGMTIIWEDDGEGIPADEKHRIFDEGFGKNTGLGLFLCREILAITGLTIQETGVPGSGVRFEIMVPDGKFVTGET